MRYLYKFSIFLTSLFLAIVLSGCSTSSSSGSSGSSGSGGSAADPGVFSVALGNAVLSTHTKIVAADATAGTNEVNGLVVDSASAKAGLAVDDATSAVTHLEVWLTDTTYFEANGSVKDKTTGSAYVVAWDAYDPAGTTNPTTTSVKAANTTTFATDKVTIIASAAAADSRMKVQVGNTLLNKTGGVVLVVSIYEPSTSSTGLGDETGRLAQYKLTITKADALTFGDAEVTALKVNATHDVNNAGVENAPEAAITGTGTYAATLLHKSGTTAGTDGQSTVWTGFAVGGGVAGLTYSVIGNGGTSTATAGVGGAAGKAAVAWNTGTTANTIATVSHSATTSAATDPGEATVTITVTDKYGQQKTADVALTLKNATS